MFTGCSDLTEAKGEKLVLSTDQYPVYDFLKTVFGSGVEVSLVKDENVKKAQDSDVHFCLSSDSFYENAFEIKKEVVIPDAEIWMSAQKATDVFYVVYNKVLSLDKRFSQKYKSKYEDYVLKLQNINEGMKELEKDKTVILANEYDLTVLESDYGLKTKILKEQTGSVMELVSQMKKENISAVYYIEGLLKEPAEVTGNMTNAHILGLYTGVLNEPEDIKNAPSYIKMLETNLKKLSER